jgi:hypothetical protein
MSDRSDDGEIPATDERPATPIEDETKTGMHRPGADPRKQIPAKEGGET